MGYLTLTLASGDSNAQGNRARFTTQLAAPLNLPEGRKFECALYSGNFPHPGGYSSVFILCNLVGFSAVGSGRAQVLYRAPPIADAAYMGLEPTNLQWLPVDDMSFGNIEVELVYGANEPIPAGQPAYDYSTITIVIREVGPRAG